MSDGVSTYQAACQQIKDLESLLSGYGYREPYVPEPPLDPLELMEPEARVKQEDVQLRAPQSASPIGLFPGSSPMSSFAGTPPLMSSWLPAGSGEMVGAADSLRSSRACLDSLWLIRSHCCPGCKGLRLALHQQHPSTAIPTPSQSWLRGVWSFRVPS